MIALALLAALATPPNGADTLRFLATLTPPPDTVMVASRAARWGLRKDRYAFGVMTFVIPVDSLRFPAWDIVDSLLSLRHSDGRKAVDGAQQNNPERLRPVQDSTDFEHVHSDVFMDRPFSDSPLPSWGQDSVRVRGAWAQGVDGEGVTIAILDTGFHWQSPEFAGRVVACIKVGNSVVDSVTPGACVQTIASCNNHGSHVASTAGGATHGIAKGASLILINTYINVGGCGNYPSDRVIASRWARAHGARVINHSTGGSGFGVEMLEVREAVAAGVGVCGAAGNDGGTFSTFPGAFPDAFSIGGLTSSLARASYSQYFPELDFALPGTSVRGLIGNTTYGAKSGTSMASPHCAGLLALILQARPTATVADMHALMQAASLDLRTPGHDNYTGWGMPRADLLVALARGVDPQPTTTAEIVIGADTPLPLTRCVPIAAVTAWRVTALPSWATATATGDELCVTVTSRGPAGTYDLPLEIVR